MPKNKKNFPESIFIDTDAIIALASFDDSNHTSAIRLQKWIDSKRIKLFISDFVVGEIVTVLSQKLGVDFASKIGKEIVNGEIAMNFASVETLKLALDKFAIQTSKNSRFTDIINMVFMEKLGIDTIFSFDKHYKKAGFKLLN